MVEQWQTLPTLSYLLLRAAETVAPVAGYALDAGEATSEIRRAM
jgi:hypothetical protein